MEKPIRPDLSSAYGDRDDSLSWPALFVVVLYSLTIGWAVLLAQHVWLWAKSQPVSSGGQQLRLVKPVTGVLPRR